MANYIQTLQETIAEKDARIAALEAQMHDMAAYLALPKFAEETWVSKYDILRMIGRY